MSKIENVNDIIDAVEARRIIECVSTLAKILAFTHLEAMKITKVCTDCIDRIERDGLIDEQDEDI